MMLHVSCLKGLVPPVLLPPPLPGPTHLPPSRYLNVERPLAAAQQWQRIGAQYVGCMKHGAVWRAPGASSVSDCHPHICSSRAADVVPPLQQRFSRRDSCSGRYAAAATAVAAAGVCAAASQFFCEAESSVTARCATLLPHHTPSQALVGLNHRTCWQVLPIGFMHMALSMRSLALLCAAW